MGVVAFDDLENTATQRKSGVVTFDDLTPDTFKNVAKNTLGDMLSRRDEAINLRDMYMDKQISLPEATYRGLGQFAKSVGDVYSGATNAADLALGRAPSSVLKSISGAAGRLPVPFDERNLGQATTGNLAALSKGYGKLQEEYPRTIGMLGATGNIAAVTPLGMLSPSKTLGREIFESGVDKSQRVLRELAQQKITPKVIKEAQIEGQEVGRMFGKKVVDLTDIEKRAFGLIKNIKGLGTGIEKYAPKTLSKKGVIIKKEADRIANDVYKELDNSNIIIPKKELRNYVSKNALEAIQDSPLITGATGATETSKKVVRLFNKVMDKADGTPSGILKARREFDKEIKRFKKSEKVFESDTDNAFSFTVKQIRNDMNEFISQKVPDINLREKLLDSHALYVANKSIADKVASQANTAFGRVIEKISGTGARAEIGKILTLGGLGGGAYAVGTALPQIALGVGGVYAGGKLLNSAMSKKLVGTLLDKGGDVLDGATRASLVEYMEQLGEETDER